MQAAGMLMVVVAMAVGMVGRLVGFRDARRGPEDVRAFLVTLGPLRAHIDRRGIIIQLAARRPVVIGRGLLIMMLGMPLSVAGAVVGPSQW